MSAENLLQYRTGLTGITFQQTQNILHSRFFLKLLWGVVQSKVRNYKSCRAFSSFDLSITRRYENRVCPNKNLRDKYNQIHQLWVTWPVISLFNLEQFDFNLKYIFIIFTLLFAQFLLPCL